MQPGWRCKAADRGEIYDCECSTAEYSTGLLTNINQLIYARVCVIYSGEEEHVESKTCKCVESCASATVARPVLANVYTRFLYWWGLWTRSYESVVWYRSFPNIMYYVLGYFLPDHGTRFQIPKHRVLLYSKAFTKIFQPRNRCSLKNLTVRKILLIFSVFDSLMFKLNTLR